jgi:hypothetical protein
MPREFVVPSVTVHADARTTRMRRSEGEFVQVRGRPLSGICYIIENFWEYYYYDPVQDSSTYHYWRQYCERVINFTYTSEGDIIDIQTFTWTTDIDGRVVLTPAEFWFVPTKESVDDLFLQTTISEPSGPFTASVLLVMFREVIRANYVPPTEETPGHWEVTREPNNPPVDPSEESSIPFVRMLCVNKSVEGQFI